MNDLHMLLYTSVLALDSSPSCVADIVRRARINNQKTGVTSLLVFDGMSFLQYLEGAAEAVGRLMDKIRRDKRHTDIRILYDQPASPPRRFDNQALAYGLTTPELLTTLFNGCSGPAAMQQFETLMPQIDFEFGAL